MRAAALLALTALGGCVSGSIGTAPMSVASLLDRQRELHGIYVRVEGVLSGCSGIVCELRDPDGTRLSITGALESLADMRRSTGRHVTVKGRFDARCINGSSPQAPETGYYACVGRAIPLSEARIIAIR